MTKKPFRVAVPYGARSRVELHQPNVFLKDSLPDVAVLYQLYNTWRLKINPSPFAGPHIEFEVLGATTTRYPFDMHMFIHKSKHFSCFDVLDPHILAMLSVAFGLDTTSSAFDSDRCSAGIEWVLDLFRDPGLADNQVLHTAGVDRYSTWNGKQWHLRCDFQIAFSQIRFMVSDQIRRTPLVSNQRLFGSPWVVGRFHWHYRHYRDGHSHIIDMAAALGS
ncbi:hypothetical protein KDA23_07390 [Candidatus Saccharibacteria bacterium]|nr:hypothetical protein [Candidatus Saccharibacteria bacterium]